MDHELYASDSGTVHRPVGGGKFGHVEEWLIKRPAPEDVQAWAAQRLPGMVAGAEALRAAAASVEAVLRLAQLNMTRTSLKPSDDQAAGARAEEPVTSGCRS